MTGREIDAAIAEHVMGLQIDDEGWVFEGDSSGGMVYPLPAYSTNISAAWLVVERVTRIPESDEEAARAANTRFALWFERTALWAMTAREAAHAICIGALEAVGVSL